MSPKRDRSTPTVDGATFMQRAQSEDQFQDAVTGAMTMHGWRWYHTFDSQRSNPGFPDLVAVRAGVVLFVELKKQDGVESDDQRLWRESLEQVQRSIDAQLASWAGVTNPRHVLVGVYLWRPSDWPAIEKVLA